VGCESGIIIAADSQFSKKQISTGRILERSIEHQKVFPLPSLPMVIVEAGRIE